MPPIFTILHIVWVYAKWIVIGITRVVFRRSIANIGHEWAADGMAVYDKLGITVRVDNRVKHISPNKPVVLIGNHPNNLGYFGAAQVAFAILGDRTPRIVYMKNGPLDRGLRHTNGIPIDQSNKDVAAETTAQALEMLKPDEYVVIYPEGARAYNNVVADNIKRLRGKGKDDQAKRFQYTLSGRPTVTQAIAAHGPACTWIAMDTTFDVPHAQRMRQTGELRGATLHVRLYTIDPPPTDREGVIQWLDERLLGPCNDWIDTIATERKRRENRSTEFVYTN